MKRKRMILIVLLLCTVLFTACKSGSGKAQMEKQLGIKLEKPLTIEFTDEHGGFHGDGHAVGKLELDEAGEKRFLSQIECGDWQELPLSENLELLLYGGEKDGISYDYNLAETAGIPKIDAGYYYFRDRHPQSGAPTDDRNLFSRSSFNFTFAVYEINTRVLYYFEFDT